MLHIREYQSRDRVAVLELLKSLHGEYKRTVLPPDLFDLTKDRDLEAAFGEYFSDVESHQGRDFMTLVAEDTDGRVVGFIIGGVEHDRWDEWTPTGVIEDWFVVDERRREGTGSGLYGRLEEWFRSQGCRRVKSDTWWSNQLSRQAHSKLGFQEYQVSFIKRLE